MAYTPNPTWVDEPSSATPITAATLNHIEGGIQAAAAVADAAIPKPSSPSANDGLVWNGTTWTNAKLVDANISPSAAIAYSKLNLLGQVTNTDVASNAAIAASKLAGYPNDSTKTLFGDGTWASPHGAATYRKTTSKAVNTTTTATDLLNGEVTIAAGGLGSTNLLRLTAWGDWLQNSGGNAAPPRIQVILGSTTLLDTGVSGNYATSATREPWRIVVEVLNSATGAQLSSLLFNTMATQDGNANTVNAFTTGEGIYYGLNVYGSTNAVPLIAQGFNTTTVDTTSSLLLSLKVINGSANAACETKLFGALAEVV